MPQDLLTKIKSNDCEVYYDQGNHYLDLGRYEEAIAFYDSSLAIKFNIAEAWFNRGFALASLGRYEEAIALHITISLL
jgi:tetratricopeptide (TPR) repeat protein